MISEEAINRAQAHVDWARNLTVYFNSDGKVMNRKETLPLCRMIARGIVQEAIHAVQGHSADAYNYHKETLEAIDSTW